MSDFLARASMGMAAKEPRAHVKISNFVEPWLPRRMTVVEFPVEMRRMVYHFMLLDYDEGE